MPPNPNESLINFVTNDNQICYMESILNGKINQSDIIAAKIVLPFRQTLLWAGCWYLFGPYVK
jgi:hypothetical protein